MKHSKTFAREEAKAAKASLINDAIVSLSALSNYFRELGELDDMYAANKCLHLLWAIQDRPSPLRAT